MPAVATVRLPTPADAAAIAALSGELGYPADPNDIATRLALLGGDPAQCVRVAVAQGGRIVGFVHAARQVLLESGEKCEVLGLVVGAGARGRGIGRTLLETVEAWARAQRLPLVSLRCNIVREPAHRFYEHLGYRALKTQHAFRKVLEPSAERTPMA